MRKLFLKAKGLLALTICLLMLAAAPAGLADENQLFSGLFLQSEANFDADEAGNTVDFSDDTMDWLLHGASIAFITRGNEGNYISIPDPAGNHHEFQMQYANDLEDMEYAFSVEAKLSGVQDGIFIKGCEPIYRVNPAYKDSEMLFCSSTYYVQNGGKSVSWNGMGGSGFCVTAKDENTLRIDVAVFEEDGIFVSHRNCAVGVSFNIKSEMNTYAFRDDNAGKVSCYINNQLFATVEYSETVTYPLDTDDTQQYAFYKNVKIKDAAGKELLSVENSRLSARNVIALAERGSAFEFDNLAVYPSHEPEPTPQATIQATPAPETEAAPATEGASEPAGENTASSGRTNEPSAEESNAPVRPEEENNYTLIIVIAAAAVAVIAGVTAYIIIKNKKKSA